MYSWGYQNVYAVHAIYKLFQHISFNIHKHLHAVHTEVCLCLPLSLKENIKLLHSPVHCFIVFTLTYFHIVGYSKKYKWWMWTWFLFRDIITVFIKLPFPVLDRMRHAAR